MRNVTLVTITRYASLSAGGVFTGLALTVLFVELAMRRLNGPDYVRMRQAEFDYFTWLTGAIGVVTLAAVILLVVVARRARSSALRPALIALVLVLAILAISVVVNGPINVEQLGWNPALSPPDWASVRDRWQIAHGVRTLAAVLVLGNLISADIALAACRTQTTAGQPWPRATSG